jgi:uncharacterized membrane protein
MTKHNFTQKEVFTEAWAKVKRHAWFLFIVFFITATIMSALTRTGIVELLACIAVSISIITASLMIVEGHTPSFNDLFKHFKSNKVPWNYTVATILYGLVVFAGFGSVVALLGTLAIATSPQSLGFEPLTYVASIACVLAIVASLYYALRFQFYKFLVIEDENLRAVSALKKSYHLTAGNLPKLVLFLITIILMNILGAIPFGLGLIVTVPVSLIAYTIVYKKFTSHE